MYFMRTIGKLAALGLFFTVTSASFAGTPFQKALAAVAIARTALEIADERPQLPDTGKSHGSLPARDNPVEVPDKTTRRQTHSPDSLPQDAAFPGKDAHTILAAALAMRSIQIEPAKADVISDVLPAQLVVQKWERGCPACYRLERDLKDVLIPLQWKIGDGLENQIQLTRIPMTETAPQILLYQSGELIKTWSGYQDPGMLSRELRAAWDSSPDRSSSAVACGSAGSIQAAVQIRQLLAWWENHVGQGRQAHFHWARTGAESFPLLAKGDWSVKALFGEAGRIAISAPGVARLPIDSLGFAYRIIGPDVEFDADPVVIPGLAARLGPSVSSEVANATPVQFVDPLTAWSIFSMLRDIWSLLHPTCDLQLGGTVSAGAVLADGKLAIDFKDCPSIKLVALFTFQLKVQRIEITESSVRLVFSGSRLVKERTFQVR